MKPLLWTGAAMLAAAMGLCACSSSDKSSKDEAGSSQGLEHRLSKWDMKKRSSFEKKAEEAENNKGVKTGPFQTKNFNAEKSFSGGDKEYHAKDFKSKEYAQAGKEDKELEKPFQSGHSDDPHQWATKSFSTKDSSFVDQKSSFAGKSFSGSSQAFQTKENAEAAKAAKKNQLPKIIQNVNPSYTEDEVRALLNKG